MAERFYGTGRRKESVARVYLTPGTGKITVNKREFDDYFAVDTLKTIVMQPLNAIEGADKFDAMITVKGGGFTGQAGGAEEDLRGDHDQ